MISRCLALILLIVLSPARLVWADEAQGGLTLTATRDSVILKWPRVEGAVWYNLYWSRIDGGATPEVKIVNISLPAVHAALTPGATYRYRVTVANAAGERDVGLTGTITLAPATPVFFDAQGAAQSATLEWDAVPGAQHYRIYWNTRGNVTDRDAAITASGTVYTHDGLQTGAHYYYRIAAQNAGGESELSPEMSVQLTSGMPTIASVTAGDGEATIAWRPVAAAESYHLYWNATGNVTRDDAKIDFVTSAFIHTGLRRGAVYYYRLSSRNVAGESELSPEVMVTLPPAAPVARLLADSDRAQLLWEPVFGATSYHLYWSTRPGVGSGSSKIATVKPPYAPPNMQAGVTYYYRVAAANAGGETLSPELAVALRPTAPRIARTEHGPRKITLHADAVIGATGYHLYWNTTGSVGSGDHKISNVKLPYVHAELSNGATYHYRLSAYNVAGESVLSPELSVTLAPDAPAMASARGGDRRVSLRWNEVPGAREYAIYWNNTGNVGVNDKRIMSGSAQWEHAPLDNGATYYYRIAAHNAGGVSELSPQATVTLAPNAPTAEVAAVGERSVTLRWDAIPGASAYNVYWNTSGNVTVKDRKIARVTPPFTHDKLNKGDTYHYLVTAANDGGETPAAPVQATLTPDAPMPPFAKGGDKRVALSWKAVNGATAYRVYWNTTGAVSANDAVIETAAANTQHEALANGSTYHYRVAALNNGGSSALSQQVTVTLAPDAPVIAQAEGGDHVTRLHWDTVPGATAYHIYWTTSADAAGKERKLANVAAPFAHEKIDNGLTYRYTVAAANAGGESLSAPVTVTLKPDAPAIALVAGGDRQATVQWSTPAGATGYTLFWNAAGNVSERDARVDPAGPPFVHEALRNGGTYFYRVLARNAAGESPLSKEASVTLVPDAPALVSAKNDDRAARLEWTPVFGAAGYRVYWNSLGKVSVRDAKIERGDASFTHAELKRGATYYYRIAAYNAGGEVVAPEFSVTLAPEATAVSGIKGADKQVTLAWKAVSGATAYHIYWNTGGNVTTADAMISTGASSHVHGKLPNGATYHYRIAAYNSGGESELSPEASVTLVPDAPVVSQSRGEDRKITLGWDAVPGATTYHIYWKRADARNAKPTKVADVKPPYVFDGLVNGVSYAYTVTAANAGGEGFASAQVVLAPHNRILFGLFRDPALQQCVNGEAAANGWTYGDDVRGVLVCNDLGIRDLSGVEWFENLTNLSLRGNHVADVKPLAGLDNLTYLALDHNEVTAVDPLSGLTRLNYLSLSSNPLRDVTPLARLAQLSSLYLNDTRVADLSPLAGLSALSYLSLYNAEVVDVRPLGALRNLTKLYLGGNRIEDVGPLAALTGLIELDVARNELGGQGKGNVGALATLKNARLLHLFGNNALSCADAAALIQRLRSPPVDLDGIPNNTDVPLEGENCVAP
jgi:titin